MPLADSASTKRVKRKSERSKKRFALSLLSLSLFACNDREQSGHAIFEARSAGVETHWAPGFCGDDTGDGKIYDGGGVE